MSVLLTVLSVLIVWVFLGLLVIALFVIMKVFGGIRINLEKIAMGVRAIEREADPFAEKTAAVHGALSSAAKTVHDCSGKVAEAAEVVSRARPRLQSSGGKKGRI